VSEHYDDLYLQSNYFGTEASPLLVEFAHLLPPGARVLDVGVGQGRNALPLAARGCVVTGLDTSRRALELTAAQADARGLHLNLVRQDVLDYDPAEPFDAVLCFGLLQMLSPPASASLIVRLHQWTGSGGALFLTAWHTGDPSFERLARDWRRSGRNAFLAPDGARHRRFLAPGELRELFAGWSAAHYAEKMGPVHRHGDGPEERHGEVTAVLINPARR